MNYYKITNKAENHNGMRYRDGLNEDVLPFVPSGSCTSGGIYFSREDILAFLGYGPWIRRVELPEGEEVYEDPEPEPKKWKSHRVVLGERRGVYASVIRELIEEGANPRVCDSRALRWAAENGHREIVEILIPVSDPRARDSWALRWAAYNGHREIVEMLIPVSDPVASDSEALWWAAENGHREIVEMLKKQIN